MNIVHFVDSLKIGGAEILAANLAIGLNARHHDCSICGLGGDGALAQRLEAQGIAHSSFDTPYGVSLKLMFNIFNIVRQKRADVIITHHFRQLFHSIPSAIFLGKRLLHIEHDFHFYENDPKSLKRLKLLLNFVNAFIVVSPGIGTWFQHSIPRLGTKLHVIENGIDTDHFKPAPIVKLKMRKQYAISDGDIVIGTCARLEPVKNISLLVESFADFHRKILDSTLVVVGDGSLLAELREQAESLGIANRVIFAGVQHNIQEFLQMFDMYAITSHNEGLPISVIEAMSCALPVIATSVGSLPELLKENAGTLIASPSPDKFSDAFLYYTDDKQAAHEAGVTGRRLIVNNYSYGKMLDTYDALIKDKS